jgi:hypothetical protein
MMGLGAGGAIEQKLYPDPYGLGTWDGDASAHVRIELVPAAEWEALTGEPPPPSPITRELYDRLGIPWFRLRDEEAGDLPAARPFDNL